jgi:hypothetical protein
LGGNDSIIGCTGSIGCSSAKNCDSCSINIGAGFARTGAIGGGGLGRGGLIGGGIISIGCSSAKNCDSCSINIGAGSGRATILGFFGDASTFSFFSSFGLRDGVTVLVK